MFRKSLLLDVAIFVIIVVMLLVVIPIISEILKKLIILEVVIVIAGAIGLRFLVHKIRKRFVEEAGRENEDEKS